MKKLVFIMMILGIMSCTKEEKNEYCPYHVTTDVEENANIREYLAFSQMLTGEVEPDSTKKFAFRLTKPGVETPWRKPANVEIAFYKPATLQHWALVVTTPRGTAPHSLVRAGACEGGILKVGFTLKNGRKFTLKFHYYSFDGVGYFIGGDEWQQL